MLGYVSLPSDAAALDNVRAQKKILFAAQPNKPISKPQCMSLSPQVVDTVHSSHMGVWVTERMISCRSA